jgi:protein TonB
VAITAVEYLTPPVLNYPLASRRLREAGRVDVRVLVDARGLPGAMQLQHSSGFERLDEEALAAVRATRFKPYTENGIAQPFWVVMPLAFELN